MATSVSRRSPSTVHPTRQQLDDLDALLKRMLDLPVNRLEDESDENEAFSQAEEEAPPVSEPLRGPHRAAFGQAPENTAGRSAQILYNTPDAEEADLKPRVIIVAPNAPENETNSTAMAPPDAAQEKPAVGQPEDWVPLTSSWRPSSRTWKPLTEAWEQAQGIDKETARQGDRETARQGDRETARQREQDTGGESRQISKPGLAAEPAAGPFDPVSLSPSLPVLLSSDELESSERATPPAPAPEWTPWYIWPLVGFNAAFDLCLAPWGPIGRWLRGPTGRGLLGVLGLLCLTAAAALAAADWISWTK